MKGSSDEKPESSPLKDEKSLRRLAKKIQDDLTQNQHWITKETVRGIEAGGYSSVMKRGAYENGRILGRIQDRGMTEVVTKQQEQLVCAV